MFRLLMAFLLAVALAQPALAAQPVRVYNRTDAPAVELMVTIYNISDPSDRWDVGILDPGYSSDLKALQEGTHVLMVIDASKEDTVLTETFYLSTTGMRIRLLREPGGGRIQAVYEDSNNP